jgi:hypothetical protein
MSPPFFSVCVLQTHDCEVHAGWYVWWGSVLFLFTNASHSLFAHSHSCDDGHFGGCHFGLFNTELLQTFCYIPFRVCVSIVVRDMPNWIAELLGSRCLIDT